MVVRELRMDCLVLPPAMALFMSLPVLLSVCIFESGCFIWFAWVGRIGGPPGNARLRSASNIIPTTAICAVDVSQHFHQRAKAFAGSDNR
jgi:hypothetical protein